MNEHEYHLRVFESRSEIWRNDGALETFLEGVMSTEAKKRYKKIADALGADYLGKIIRRAKEEPESFDFLSLDEESRSELEAVAQSMTSQNGRALVHILILQLAIKCIEPNQSIRLHKASARGGAFGWVEGVSMRTLDASFVTPALRESNLSKVNSFGAFMTRTFAENYPYSSVYKAGIMGARQQWLSIVEKIEAGFIDPAESLALVLFKLINLADEFEVLADEVMDLANEFVGAKSKDSYTRSYTLLIDHFQNSEYSARLMELVMHSLLQAVEETNGLAGLKLKPLAQMRNANLKNSNFGDVELVDDVEIVAAWDAKFDKSNMREELEELEQKFIMNSPPGRFGFVTSLEPDLSDEITRRVAEISADHVVDLEIVQLGNWLKKQFDMALELGIDADLLSGLWVTNYAGSLAQRRREVAPIDEPCLQWLTELKDVLTKSMPE
jgi:hypothetical protein